MKTSSTKILENPGKMLSISRKGEARRDINEKSTEEIQCFFAPAGIELLNLWNDFRKVVKFIDENPWVKPMLEKIIQMKNRDNV